MFGTMFGDQTLVIACLNFSESWSKPANFEVKEWTSLEHLVSIPSHITEYLLVEMVLASDITGPRDRYK